MAKQEAEHNQNIEQAAQNEYIKLKDILDSFETFGAQFQAIKEKENPHLLSGGSINGECELSDRRHAEITWTRNYKIYSLDTGFTSGWIILKDEYLRQQGIRRIGYKFGREVDEEGNSKPSIIKTTLRDDEGVAKGMLLSNNKDRQELVKINALIKELSDKFSPVPQTKVTPLKETTKGPKSIFDPIMKILKRKQ